MSDLIKPCPKCGSPLPFKGHRCGPRPPYGDLEQQLKAKDAEVEALKAFKEKYFNMLITAIHADPKIVSLGELQEILSKEIDKEGGEQV